MNNTSTSFLQGEGEGSWRTDDSKTNSCQGLLGEGGNLAGEDTTKGKGEVGEGEGRMAGGMLEGGNMGSEGGINQLGAWLKGG